MCLLSSSPPGALAQHCPSPAGTLCAGHGTCEASSGTCLCTAGYGSTDCSIFATLPKRETRGFYRIVHGCLALSGRRTFPMVGRVRLVFHTVVFFFYPEKEDSRCIEKTTYAKFGAVNTDVRAPQDQPLRIPGTLCHRSAHTRPTGTSRRRRGTQNDHIRA